MATTKITIDAISYTLKTITNTIAIYLGDARIGTLTEISGEQANDTYFYVRGCKCQEFKTLRAAVRAAIELHAEVERAEIEAAAAEAEAAEQVAQEKAIEEAAELAQKADAIITALPQNADALLVKQAREFIAATQSHIQHTKVCFIYGSTKDEIAQQTRKAIEAARKAVKTATYIHNQMPVAEAQAAEQVESEQPAPAALPAPQFKKLEALLEAKKQNDDKRIAIDAAFIQSEIDRIRKTMDKAAHIALQISPYRIQYNDRFVLNIYSAHAHVSLVLEYTGGFFPVTGYVRNNSGDIACYTNAKVIEKSDYYFVDSDAILKTAFSAVDLDVIDNFIVNLLSKKHIAKRDFDINI